MVQMWKKLSGRHLHNFKKWMNFCTYTNFRRLGSLLVWFKPNTSGMVDRAAFAFWYSNFGSNLQCSCKILYYVEMNVSGALAEVYPMFSKNLLSPSACIVTSLTSHWFSWHFSNCPIINSWPLLVFFTLKMYSARVMSSSNARKTSFVVLIAQLEFVFFCSMSHHCNVNIADSSLRENQLMLIFQLFRKSYSEPDSLSLCITENEQLARKTTSFLMFKEEKVILFVIRFNNNSVTIF